MMNLKDQLKFHIRKNGLTASELSRKSGVSKQTISLWLAGTMPKNLTQLKQVCEILNVTIDQLCFNQSNQSQELQFFDHQTDGWLGGLYEIKIRKIKN